MDSQSSNLRISQNNTGSAIITVVVSMLFVMAFGAALLFAAYTGYKITISERADKTNFYSASSALDDIRAGIQTKLTESIANAYTDVLVEYTTQGAEYDPQTVFNDKIIEELASKTVVFNGVDVNLFNSNTINGKVMLSSYNATGLKALIDSQAQGCSTLADGAISGTYSSDGVLTSITLKSINIKYINTGYESDISSDITISMPILFDSSSVSSGINNYALIANNGLIHSSVGDVVVDGSVFVGSAGITVSGNPNKLTFTNGDVISKGTISVDNSAILAFRASTHELWASEIKLGTSCSATFDGKVYVADDLVLNGYGSSATLTNSYFGFGSSITDPNNSSSILINGRNSHLDISGLNMLSLAGVSFIDINSLSDKLYNSPDDSSSANSYSTAITMGESLSVKSDQLAYLVPVKCISNYPSNPCVFDAGVTSTKIIPTVDTSIVLWGTGAESKTLASYIENGKGSFKALYNNLGNGMKIAYVFIIFNNKTYANEYFQDYFAADPSKIQQYLNLYLSLSDKADNAQINAAGNTFYMDDKSTATASDDTLTIQPAVLSVYANGYQARYSSLISPFAAYVNTTELAKITSNTILEFQNAAGEVVAVVSTSTTNEGFHYVSSSPKTLRLIIASNNVTIDEAFSGIIIARNNININKNVTTAMLDSSLLDATCTVGSTTYMLSNFIGNSALFGQTTTTSKDSWDLDSLVFYENWTKQ